MRIAIFTETFLPKVDGIVTVACLLLDHLSKRGIETTIVAPKMGVERYNDTPVIGVPGVTMPLYPEVKVGPAQFGTYRQVKAFQPDLIHVFHPVLIGQPGMLMARALGVPVLASFHLDVAQLVHHFNLSFLESFSHFMTRLVFNGADYALAPSQPVLEYMRGLGIEGVGLWRRGVDSEQFNPRHYNESMRLALSAGHPDETLLLYVGRLSTEKRLHQIRAVLEALPGTRLALVGDGPARAELEAHFAGTPTTFMGYLSGAALSQAYASADVFVFPSSLETFGLVIVEAMAAGLPVVAAQVGGVMETVVEGQTGYTFKIDDVAGMIAGVRQAVASREHLREMGVAARAFAETQSWDVIMDEVVEHYERLILTQRRKGAKTRRRKGFFEPRIEHASSEEIAEILREVDKKEFS
jgi:glycosyltransferase involved in cell wall biosynthesis